jgi:DMSO/TMAO reductase YedYZ heme-binding membrane subunit
LAVVHFLLRVKKVTAEPLVYAIVLAVLFLVRIVDFIWERMQKKSAK